MNAARILSWSLGSSLPSWAMSTKLLSDMAAATLTLTDGSPCMRAISGRMTTRSSHSQRPRTALSRTRSSSSARLSLKTGVKSSSMLSSPSATSAPRTAHRLAGVRERHTAFRSSSSSESSPESDRSPARLNGLLSSLSSGRCCSRVKSALLSPGLSVARYRQRGAGKDGAVPFTAPSPGSKLMEAAGAVKAGPHEARPRVIRSGLCPCFPLTAEILSDGEDERSQPRPERQETASRSR